MKRFRYFVSWFFVVVWFMWRVTIETPLLVIPILGILATFFGIGYWLGAH